MKFTLFVILLFCAVFLVTAAPKSFTKDVVKRHNVLRAKHQLSRYAQKWAKYLAENSKFEHRPENKYGKNIAFMSGSATGAEYVDYLYSTEEEYYRNMGYYSMEPPMENSNFGHFRQIVWKGSRKIGVGKAGGVVVINYDPPGNYLGAYNANVFPPLEDK